jgi:hypothetical protein
MSFSSPFSFPTPRQVRLAAGQSLHEWVGAGTIVRLIDGDVQVLAPPQWLAESVVRSSGRLGSGSIYVVPTRGWLTVSATTAASLQVEPAVLPGVRAVSSALNRLRRMAAGVAGRQERA